MRMLTSVIENRLVDINNIRHYETVPSVSAKQEDAL